MKLIVAAEKDIAASNMHELFVKEFGFQEDGEFEGHAKYKKDDFVLIKCKKDILHTDYLNEFFNPKIWICASRHKSEGERKTLSCHTPGNFSKAEAGGKEKELCYAPALYLRKALRSLEKENKQDYEVTLEVTHHGPSDMNAPCLFVEVGGSEKEWNDIEACRTVCKAILSLDKVDDSESYAGFGGPHYAPKFTKLVLQGYAVGHIMPQYNVDDVDEEMILQAVEKTVPKANKAIIEWKGLKSSQRQKIISVLEKNNIEWKKDKELTK